MTRIFKDEAVKFETAVLDGNGDFVLGLTVTYEIRKCADDSLVASGTMSAVGNVYSASYTFADTGEYRILYTTPDTYENGFENVLVDEYDSYKADVNGINLRTTELHELAGLNSANPLVVNRTSRRTGTINQSINGNTDQVIVRRL